MAISKKPMATSSPAIHIKGKQFWEDTKFGWFPCPKTERAEFYNNLLPKYFDSAWRYKTDPMSFKKSFLKEASRQWNLKKEIKHSQELYDFSIGTNDSSVGHLLRGGKLKIGCDSSLNRNKNKMITVKSDLTHLNEKIVKFEKNIHDASGTILKKPYKQECTNYNVDMMSQIRQLVTNIDSSLLKCDALLQKYSTCFPKNKSRGRRTSEGIFKKKKRSNKRKAEKRKLSRCLSHMKYVCSTIISGMNVDISPQLGSSQNSYLDLCTNIITTQKVPEQCVQREYISSKLSTYDMTAMAVMIESGVFEHKAVCVILEDLTESQASTYWQEYYEYLYPSSDDMSDEESDDLVLSNEEEED